MKITVLGAGTIVPSRGFSPSGFLVEVGGKKILLDCGHGTIRRMVEEKIDYRDIDLVFVSHFHTDHLGDAFNFIHVRWVTDMKRKKKQNLIYLGPQMLEKCFKKWREIFWPEPKESYPVDFLEGTRQIKLGGVQIETFPVSHVAWFKSVGIAISYQNKKLVYTGDMGSKQKLGPIIKLAKNSDLLITEATNDFFSPNHYGLEQVINLAQKSGAKKVLAVHVNPTSRDRIKKQILKQPNFIYGRDGLKMDI